MRRALSLAPALAALAGFVFTLLLFYPGYMSWDSAYQWWQARHDRFDATHPPLLAMIWQVSDRIIPGPGGMLVLQAFLLWSALAVFASALPSRPGVRVLVVLGLGLWPPLFGLLPHIWKDLWTLAGFAWALALLAQELDRPLRSLRIAALLALAFACAFRHNAITGALPLIGWLAWRELRGWKLQFVQRRLFTSVAGLTVVLSLAIWFVASLPARDPRVQPVDRIWALVTLWDAAAVSLAEGRLLYPPTLIAPDTRLQDLRQHFSDYSNTTVFVSGKLNLGVDGRYTPAERAALDELALALPRQHARAYFGHRLRLAQLLFGWDRTALPDHQVFSPGLHVFDDNPALSQQRSSVNAWAQPRLSALVDTPLFAGWIYLAVCAVLLPVGAWRARHAQLAPSGALAAFAAVVAASALTYALPLTLASGSAEFRYLAWPVLATLCAAVLLWRQKCR